MSKNVFLTIGIEKRLYEIVRQDKKAVYLKEKGKYFCSLAMVHELFNEKKMQHAENNKPSKKTTKRNALSGISKISQLPSKRKYNRNAETIWQQLPIS